MQQALVLYAGPILQGDTLQSFAEQQGIALASCSAASADAVKGRQLGKFQAVLSLADQPSYHSVAVLGQLAGLLQPGGFLTVQEPASATSSAEALHKELVLSGFVSPATASALPQAGASSAVVTVRASKPAFETGAKATFSLRRGAKPAQAPPAAPAQAPAPAARKWALAAGDLAEEEEELLDDEELLTAEDRQRPSLPSASDCGVGATKKACKNCTCGRADAEAAVVAPVSLTPDMLANPTSACGSCGLGDAFRCASCPYRGLPTFETGKKIELPSDFLTADV